MAEFKAGDRVVKMSGIGAGKYGTVNSVMESGTLNVTFDGERLPKYCDPALCGKVAANAKFKVGEKIQISADVGAWRKGENGTIIGGDYLPGYFYVKFDGGSEGRIPEDKMTTRAANACARNAITGKGRISLDDDVVEVFDPSGRSVYKGKWDDCPYKHDDWRYDSSSRTYRVDGPNGDYRIIAKISNAVARNAGESAHFKLFQGMARAAVGEILYAAEGELRALTGKAKECADAARAQGDAKTVSDIARVLSLLKDAVRKHHSDCLRTIG